MGVSLIKIKDIYDKKQIFKEHIWGEDREDSLDIKVVFLYFFHFLWSKEHFGWENRLYMSK